jgi:pilus assembly protein Flp/PilA
MSGELALNGPGTQIRIASRRRHMKFLKKLRRDEKGATAIEYGLIAALIAVAAITAMSGLGSQLSTTFTKAKDKMATSNSV